MMGNGMNEEKRGLVANGVKEGETGKGQVKIMFWNVAGLGAKDTEVEQNETRCQRDGNGEIGRAHV